MATSVTPWFLSELGLDEGTDESSIRKAYARRLKTIDQATDVAGFMRLREAYEQALAWARGARDTQTVAPALEPRPTVEAPPEGARLRAPSSVATPRGQESPQLSASDALAALERAIRGGSDPATALQEVVHVLRRGRLNEPYLFETLLIDALAESRLPKRLPLYYAAQACFAWSDVSHLRELGHRGAWLDDVGMEMHAWRTESDSWVIDTLLDRPGGTPLLERETLSPQDFSEDTALDWPRMQHLLRRYPHYLALRYDVATMQAWGRAFLLVTDSSARKTAATSEPSSSNTSRPKRVSAAAISALIGVGVLVLIAGLILVANLARHPDASTLPTVDASTPPTAPETEAHRLRAAVPELPADAPADERTCAYIEHAVHAADWNPPDDADLRLRLRSVTTLCLNLRIWPNRSVNDPQLRKLGIEVTP